MTKPKQEGHNGPVSLTWYSQLKIEFIVIFTIFFCHRMGTITKTHLFKYIENFTKKKTKENFQIKDSDIFHISAQNIDCGYSLEPPRRGGSNE